MAFTVPDCTASKLRIESAQVSDSGDLPMRIRLAHSMKSGQYRIKS
jgi:hypothetical protein